MYKARFLIASSISLLLLIGDAQALSPEDLDPAQSVAKKSLFPTSSSTQEEESCGKNLWKRLIDSISGCFNAVEGDRADDNKLNFSNPQDYLNVGINVFSAREQSKNSIYAQNVHTDCA